MKLYAPEGSHSEPPCILNVYSTNTHNILYWLFITARIFGYRVLQQKGDETAFYIESVFKGLTLVKIGLGWTWFHYKFKNIDKQTSTWMDQNPRQRIAAKHIEINIHLSMKYNARAIPFHPSFNDAQTSVGRLPERRQRLFVRALLVRRQYRNNRVHHNTLVVHGADMEILRIVS